MLKDIFCKKILDHKYEVRIIDDQFEDLFHNNGGLYNMHSHAMISGIITSYGKRQLNITKNLFLYMLLIEKADPSWHLEKQLNCYWANIPEFIPFAFDIQHEINSYKMFI